MSDKRCVICLQDGHKCHNFHLGKYLVNTTMRPSIIIRAAICAAIGFAFGKFQQAHAADLAPDYLNLGGLSYHFNSNGKRVHGLNERKAGLVRGCAA